MGKSCSVLSWSNGWGCPQEERCPWQWGYLAFLIFSTSEAVSSSFCVPKGILFCVKIPLHRHSEAKLLFLMQHFLLHPMQALVLVGTSLAAGSKHRKNFCWSISVLPPITKGDGSKRAKRTWVRFCSMILEVSNMRSIRYLRCISETF